MGSSAHASTVTSPARARARVCGAVQGVGFRPFVWTLAREMDLSGWVLNDAEGVLLEVEGKGLDGFFQRLRTEAPPLARIDSVETVSVDPSGVDGFEIRASSKATSARTMVTADAATCPACLEDVFDPANRRYGYPFTNCTHCGPRYTITHELPYDRAQTSMAGFTMCPTCQGEYEDPADRRFHAQPNACPTCGPRLSMDTAEIMARLGAGEIVAIKGLGGFHLAVDARNNDAVSRLRNRKGRDGKPFAVMVAGLASARRYGVISGEEEALLTDRTRPIVIVKERSESGLAQGVSEGLPTLGLMLPYTPLHYLLFHEVAGKPAGTAWMDEPLDCALVMTSANPGGEPLVTGNTEAFTRLADIADAIVTHDRDIVVRCDDSVMRMVAGAPAFLRRARGFVPEPIKLAHAVPSVLAVGSHLKNTVCVTRGDEAFVSQHVGDLDNAASFEFFRETVAHLTDVLEVSPDRVACDLHPDFLSTHYAQETGLPLVSVQHHHAHLAAVAAEHHVAGPVLGLALDGFGLGADGHASWGGERMLMDGSAMKHLGGLAPLRQPGGDRAAREPWRMAAAALSALGRSEEIAERFPDVPGAAMLTAMLERGVNSPETSSAGRLFDAACGLLDVKTVASFEGEAPMALEALVKTPTVLENGWVIRVDGTLDLLPVLDALRDRDSVSGAALFHGTFATALVDWVRDGLKAHALPPRVLLGGGCMQNKVLAETISTHLEACGIQSFLPRQVPANDGGLSLGQAWIAAHTEIS